MVFTVESSSSSQIGSSSSSQNAPKPLDSLPPLPEEITEMIADLALKERSQLNWKNFLTILLSRHGMFMKGLTFHPEYPFLNIYHISDLYKFPKEALCFFWYLFESHTIAMSFNSCKLLTYLYQCQLGDLTPANKNTLTLLQWFLPAHQWCHKISIALGPYVVFMFRRPCAYIPPSSLKQSQSAIYHAPMTFLHEWYDRNPSSFSYQVNNQLKWLQMRYNLANANMVPPHTIPDNVMNSQNVWSDHPLGKEWDKALSEGFKRRLCVDMEKSDIEEPEDSEYDGHYDEDPDEDGADFDPYEDDPSHPDSRWK